MTDSTDDYELKGIINTLYCPKHKGLFPHECGCEPRCICCQEFFSERNVFTKEGWREIRTSQMCEKCFDECTMERDEEE